MRLVGYYERRALRSHYKKFNKLNIQDNEVIKAFHVTDLGKTDMLIGDWMFEVNMEDNKFVLLKEENIVYDIKTVLEDEGFMLVIYTKDEC